MIYIISNGRYYSDRRLYFIEAQPAFAAWFTEVFRPWVTDRTSYGEPRIIARADHIAWWEGGPASPDVLAKDYEYLEKDENDPFPAYQAARAAGEEGTK